MVRDEPYTWRSLYYPYQHAEKGYLPNRVISLWDYSYIKAK